MSIETAARDLAEAMQPKAGPAPYDTSATVLRVEGDTLWVHIPGGADETPVQRTINAAPGDTIQIRVGGGSAWAVGNASAPPTDDARANAAHSAAETADGKAVRADEKAEEALEQLKVHRAEIEQLFADWAQIGTAIINTLQATGVNADWINAGTLNAARIGAGTISADKLTVGQGGNLYPVYDSFEQVTNDTLSYFHSSSITPTVVNSPTARNGNKVASLVASSATGTRVCHFGDPSNGYGQIRLQAGSYVASAYFRVTVSGISEEAQLRVFSRESRGATWDTGEYTELGMATISMTNAWTRVEVPFTLTANRYVSMCFATSVTSRTFQVDCMQIERVSSGQSAGEWHPAGVTQIDGGNIVAQSIKAESLDVDSLFAEDITATGSFQIDNDYFSLTANQGGVNIQAKSNLNSVRVGGIYCGTGTPEIGGNAIVAAMHKTVTGTTNTSGNIALNIPVATYGVLCVWRTDVTSICTPYYPTTMTGWYAHVATTAGAAVTSTAVTLEVDYYYRIAIKPK